MPSEVPSEVVDDSGRVWPLGEPLGSGGQGAVYRVKDRDLAVKLLHTKTPETRDRLRRRLQAVRHLPLDGLPVATPQALLAPPLVGYVMKLVDGVEPIDALLPPPRLGDAQAWHLRTGGLQRRLRLLARLAGILERLHGKAVIYGDLSWDNVLVSSDIRHDKVWLIDPDNLRFETAAGPLIHTRGFGAPELLRREVAAPTTLTEAHSLAVLVWQVLTLSHPFIDGEAADASPEDEDLALTGSLPWVAHPEDDSNAQIGGLPWHGVMHPRAFALARETFEGGLTSPAARPGVGEWASELRWAASICVPCPSCQATYLATAKRCPWCEEPRPRLVLLTTGISDGDLRTRRTSTSTHLVVPENGTGSLCRDQAFAGSDLTSGGDPVLQATFEGQHLRLEAVVEGMFLRKAADGERRDLVVGRGTRLRFEGKGRSRWTIHFGPDGDVHRTADLQLQERSV